MSVRPLVRTLVAAAVLLAAAPAAATGPATPAPNWATYHATQVRTGFDPSSSTAVTPTHAWQSATLDGPIYAEPLVVGSTVYVATENNSVYALAATTGKIIWHRRAGVPVPAGVLPCGNIGPTVGITGTPVIDSATNAIYAVADIYTSATGAIAHKLVAYNLTTGAPLFGPRPVDVGGGSSPEFVPANQLQRAGLARDGRTIVIAFGGNDGDCGHYHGWLVGVADNGTGPLLHYQVGTNADNGGAIWGGGGGPVVGSAGDIYASTGNGFSTGTYDHGDSIIELSPTLHELDHYAPSTWAADNGADLDLGSENAMLLPGGYLFQSGKNGQGYLVNSTTGKMGGTGSPTKPDPSAFHATVCPSGGWGGPAYFAGTIYAACGDPGGGGGGVVALHYNAATPSFKTAWTGPADATAPPIVAGGRVWVVSVSDSILYGLNPSTGHIDFQTSIPGAEHFTTPSAGGGRLFLATDQTVNAYVIAANG